MLQDIEPHVYHNEMSDAPPSPGDMALVYVPEGVLCRMEGQDMTLPTVGQVTAGQWIYGFSIDTRRYYISLTGGNAPGFSPRRDYREKNPDHTVFACAVGHSLFRWYGANRFCGTCGEKMLPAQRERAMKCARCGHVVYPKICPAVIVAVCHGEKLLLTKYAGRGFTRYALVAGFCEIGETVEQCVRREVFEETGLRVGRLRYYKSQPWVVTDSLLMGFFAELEGSQEIRLQEDELSEGRWFDRKSLPYDHSGDSLTGEMIEVFRCGQEPQG